MDQLTKYLVTQIIVRIGAVYAETEEKAIYKARTSNDTTWYNDVETSFDAVNNFYRSISGVGEIVNNEERVLYKAINYRIDKGTDAAIIFIDVPSILKSALQYYKIPMFESKKNLQELLQREMNNFQSEIIRMIENDELDDKVSVRLYS